MNIPYKISTTPPLFDIESLTINGSQGEPPFKGREENSLEGKRRVGNANSEEITEDSTSSSPRGNNEKKFALSE